MPNYQNNMRYGRMQSMYSQPRQNYNGMMTKNENCGCRAIEKETQQCEPYSEERSVQERNLIRQGSGCSCQNERESVSDTMSKDLLSQMPLAMAYVPWQKWCGIYETCKGFQRGTIFAGLDKPFLGRGGCNR